MLTKREILLKQINVFEPENLISKGEWEMISFDSELSEEFIREFKNEVHWYNISAYQKLSEDFIREFKELVVWRHISRYQKLSSDFIREFEHLMEWDFYFYHQQAPFEIMKTFIRKSSFSVIEQFSTKHLSVLERKEIDRIFEFKHLFKK